jgi:hypothetical protein
LSTTGGTAPTATNVGVAGTVSLLQYGYLNNVVVTRGTAGAAAALSYTFTMPTAHPLGQNYSVGMSFRTGSTAEANPNAILTHVVNTSTTFVVWIRTTIGANTNVILDGNFNVWTVP